jgi:hypothetical protein
LNVNVASGGSPRWKTISASTRRASPPQHRGPLCHLLGAREPVEPRQQRVLQGHWNRRRRGVTPRLHHRLRQLLGEERNAVGARGEHVHDIRG